jgi:superkiller protein 3
MSSSKAQLKAIGDAVKKDQFDVAVSKAKALLEADPKNYFA